MTKLIKILDFDGVITDEIEEAKPFIEKFLDLYSEESSISREEVELLFDKTISMIKKDESSGIDFNGKIVAPAVSSQYLLYQVAAQKIYYRKDDRMLQYTNRIKKMNLDKITEIYYPSYNASATSLRRNAKAFLELNQDAIIITNSNTDKVKSKLDTIGMGHMKIYGNAKKFTVTEQINNVPETINEILEEDLQKIIPRPIYLWRGNYKKVLDDVCGKNTNVVVIGDVWEFDNALPTILGYDTITIDNLTTDNKSTGLTNYERDIIPKLPNSYIVNSLSDASELLQLLQR